MFGVCGALLAFLTIRALTRLLGDPIIFQNKTKSKIPPTINAYEFLKPQAEKSFNQEQKLETKEKIKPFSFTFLYNFCQF